jgi:hypothetical protein
MSLPALPFRRLLFVLSSFPVTFVATGLQAQDLGGEPLHGTVQLIGGFTPDPWITDIVPGGDTAVADLGAGCTGFIYEAQPDLRVEYTQAASTFGIFVNSSVDTTLVVNDPEGNWHCSDDAEFLDNSNPGIAFNEPLGGVYDIWVGTYGDIGLDDVGKLVLTEWDPVAWTILDLGDNGTALAVDGIDFGDDLGSWANDGECDDPRFTGPGTASTLIEADRYHDATDCAAAWAAGTIRLDSAGVAAATAGNGVQRGRLDTSDPTFSDGSFVDRYTFDGSAGSVAIIDLRSADFDTYLRVTAPSGSQFTNDDYDGATDRSLLSLELDESGEYLVEVTSYAGGETGAYTLDMNTNLQVAPAQLENSGTLAAGDSTFSDGEYYDTFTFEGQPGQIVTIDLRSRDFDTYLVLESPDGHREANDDADGTEHSRIVSQLSQLGTYTVYVTSYAGGETGAYTLGIDQQGGGRIPAHDPVSLSLGDSTNGRLDNVDRRSNTGRYEDVYSFDGVAGATLQVDMRSSEFDTYLTIVAPNGETWENDDFDNDTSRSLVDFTLPQSGRYRIVASSYATETTGSYELALTTGTGNNSSVVYLPASRGGEIYGVFAGIADYPGEGNDLDRTDQDALRARDALLEGAGMSPDKAWTLLNSDATLANFGAAMRDIGATIGQDDTLVIFFSGHGSQHPRATGPSNTDPDGVDESLVFYDGFLLDDELAAMLDNMNAGRVLLVFDSCYSGGFAKDVVSAPGRMGLFSSEEDVTSRVAVKFSAGGYLSVFFEDAVRNRFADGDRNGELTAMELSEYIHERYRFDLKPEGSEASSARVTGPAASYQHFVVDRGGVTANSVLFYH